MDGRFGLVPVSNVDAATKKEIQDNSAVSQRAPKQRNEAKDKNELRVVVMMDDDVVGETQAPMDRALAIATGTTYVVSASESSVSKLLAALLCRPSESSL
jgi:hypothetical protein